MEDQKLPIGYYLKKVDNLLTDGIESIHKEFSVSRIEWQLLNSIHQDVEIDEQTLFRPLLQFAGKEELEKYLDDLKAKGLVTEGLKFKLTDKGISLWSKCVEKQKDFRMKAMKDISEGEYFQVIATLEKMIKNLK